MSERKKVAQQRLMVEVNYELSRLEEQNLSAAYELVLPISDRVASQARTDGVRTKRAKPKQDQLQMFSTAACQ